MAYAFRKVVAVDGTTTTGTLSGPVDAFMPSFSKASVYIPSGLTVDVTVSLDGTNFVAPSDGSALAGEQIYPYTASSYVALKVTRTAGSGSVVIIGDTVVGGGGGAAAAGGATAANQTNGSQKTQIVDGSGNVIGSTSNALDVNIKSGVTLEVNLDNANDDVLVYGFDGSANQKIKTDAAGELQVDVLTLPALAAGTNNIGDVDILSIAAGDNNIGNVDLASAIPAGTNNIGDVDVLTLPALPAGTNNIGDVDVLTIAAGTNTIGNMIPAAGAAGTGATTFRSLDLDESEEEVKATAGTLYGFQFYNAAASTRYLKMYNATAANVTVGTTTPVRTYPVPATTAGTIIFPVGVNFDTAITMAVTTGLADNDTGAPAANDFQINVDYK